MWKSEPEVRPLVCRTVVISHLKRLEHELKVGGIHPDDVICGVFGVKNPSCEHLIQVSHERVHR